MDALTSLLLDVRSFITDLQKWSLHTQEEIQVLRRFLRRIDPVIIAQARKPEWVRANPPRPGWYFVCHKQTEEVSIRYISAQSLAANVSAYRCHPSLRPAADSRFWMEIAEPERPWQAQPGCSKPGCGFPDGEPCIGCGRVVMPSLECVDGEGI